MSGWVRFAVVALLAMGLAPAQGAVVILLNRGTRIAEFTLQRTGEAPGPQALRPRDQLCYSATGPVTLRFGQGSAARSYQLDPNSIYYFGNVGETLDLQQIGLGKPTAPVELDASFEARKHASPVLSIPIKALVDDEEVQNEAAYQERIRKRLAAASEIFEQTARLRFEVVAFDRWESDDATNDFTKSLAEFEAETQPSPGWIAIGFTSQYNNPQGATKLGGTRGAFHPYLLMREWPQHVSERERLEVLVHELGHILGCVHSPEQDSVMRPVLGDRVARLKDFRIGFDPLNSLAMWIIGEEMRVNHARSTQALSEATRTKLAEIYEALAAGLPKDPAAPVYLARTRPGDPRAGGLSTGQTPDVRQVQLVYDAVWQAAQRNALLPPAAQGEAAKEGFERLEGDALADLYFREAALAAKLLPEKDAATAYLGGLALALVDPAAISLVPPLAKMARDVGPPSGGNPRETIGAPTLLGRADWMQHFTLSAALTATLGPQLAESAGLAKELTDARAGGSGFSFGDYSADLAGMLFAQRLRATPKILELFPNRLRVSELLAPPEGLEESLSREEFQSRYGGPNDSRFQNRRAELMRATASAKGYLFWNEALAKEPQTLPVPKPID